MGVRILFAKSNWEVADWPLPDFAKRARGAGFGAAEIYLPWRGETASETGTICRGEGLDLIAHLSTEGPTVVEHLEFLEKWFGIAAGNLPVHVNLHTGRDFFSFADNLRILERAEELSKAFAIPVSHETHRGRALFSAQSTAAYLKAFADFGLTADFSHWVCVSESDLSDQQSSVDQAIHRTAHVHARVGFNQGPQVHDPRAVAHAGWLGRFEEFWDAIVASAEDRGLVQLFFTPEFGPPPYARSDAPRDDVVRDVWETNLWMRERLASRYARWPVANRRSPPC